MGTTPNQLKRDIEQTRADLSDDVDVLTEKVSPRAAARRTGERARNRLASVKDTVMGKASDLTDSASDAGSSVTDRIADAPRATRRNTQGSPLSAGLIAFGIGAVVASALPTSRTEQRAAQQLKERAEPYAEQAKQQLSREANDLRDELQPHLESAAHDVGDSAREAAQETADEARGRGREVTGHARGAAKQTRTRR